MEMTREVADAFVQFKHTKVGKLVTEYLETLEDICCQKLADPSTEPPKDQFLRGELASYRNLFDLFKSGEVMNQYYQDDDGQN